MNRNEAIETKEFKTRFGDMCRDSLSDEQLAIVGGYCFGEYRDLTAAGRYLCELVLPEAEAIIRDIVESHAEPGNGDGIYAEEERLDRRDRARDMNRELET